MTNPLAGVRGRVAAVFSRARRSRPALDHLVRAWQRYTADQGNQLAAAVTYFSFLSMFPLLLVGLAILGYALNGNPAATAQVESALRSALPGVGGIVTQTLHQVAANRAASGIVGIIGLLYSGLGWVDNLRTALRTVWHQNVNEGTAIVTKVKDLIVLGGLGGAVLVSVALTGLGNAATVAVVRFLGVTGVPGVGIGTKLVSLLLAMAADVLIFLWLFLRLARVRFSFRPLLHGAVFAAVGFEILKLVGAVYIARIVHSGGATYGTFAVVVGLLVWINLVSRFLIVAAEWTVTAPYDDDVAPSGSADAPNARRAQPRVVQPASGAPVPGARAARTAGRLGVGAVVAGAIGVAVVGARSVRQLTRR